MAHGEMARLIVRCDCQVKYRVWNEAVPKIQLPAIDTISRALLQNVVSRSDIAFVLTPLFKIVGSLLFE
jgi:hypothetical protein